MSSKFPPRAKIKLPLSRLWRNQRGAVAAEYALLLAIIAGGLAVALNNLGVSIFGAMNNTAGLIETATDGNCNNNGLGSGFGGGNGGGGGQGAGRGAGNTC